MSTYIRLTEYKDGESKERGFFEAKNRYVAKQEDFAKIPGSPIAYWVSERVKEIFEKSQKLGEVAEPKQGLITGDNDKFLRFWHEVDNLNIGFGLSNRDGAKKSNAKWFPHNKGGEFRKWYGNNDYIVNWDQDGYEIINFYDEKGKQKSRPQNIKFYFQEGITWTSLTSGNFNGRYSNNSIFDAKGPMLFNKDSSFIAYMLSLLNSSISNEILRILAPTMDYNQGPVGNLPIIFPKSDSTKQLIDTLTQECIDISREEWDSRETSWDFKQNELIRHKKDDGKIASAYAAYCDYWREKFYKLHANEEELNRLFIEIYELQDELTPDVALKDITILKSEARIENGELVFNAGEIARQFVSYAIGCMFGRYSLEIDGLVMANQGESCEKYFDMSSEATSDRLGVDFRQNLTKNRSLQGVNEDFEEDFNAKDMPKIALNGSLVDDDNILPVLEEEVFPDDIVARFGEFVRVVFGDEHYETNIAWIESALGMSVRKYFVSEFYKDHVRRYKKRPIYWLIQSPKKSFSALIYMHRYQSDTMARVQTMYLREYITKTEARIASLQNIVDSPASTPKEQAAAKKELAKLEAKVADARAFDRGEMSRVAALRIEIDLDDGVKVNYQKFKGVLADIGIAKDE